MKKILLIFLTSITSLFGQNLKFDVMAKYSETKDNKTSEKIVYGNSSNDNYIMQITNQYDGKQVAKVYDLNTLKMHVFNVIDSKLENGKINYSYIYTKTEKIEKIIKEEIYFDFQYVSTENNVETVNLTFYENKLKTKISGVIELKVLKSEVNFFPLYRFASLHPLEFLPELTYSNRSLVISSKSLDNLSNSILSTFADTNVEITIPN